MTERNPKACRGQPVRHRFDLDPAKEKANASKHSVSFRTVTTVFGDPNQLSIYDEEHSEDEDRWITLGFDSAGILRVVVHTFEQVEEALCRIRIISARTATRAEESQYREANI